MIEVKNLSKSRGSQVVLRDLSFHVGPGEIVVLLGENGAGKSTALDILFGLLPADSGQVFLEGEPTSGNDRRWQVKTSLVAERLGLYPHLTIREQCVLTGELYALDAQETIRRTEILLDYFDLKKSESKRAHECSMGMQNKLSIVLGLLPGPRYILIDEALNGLDPVSVVRTRILLQKLVERGVGILVCSHVLDHLENFGDRVLILKEGRVWSETSKVQLQTSGTSLERLYLEAHPELQTSGEPWSWF